MRALFRRDDLPGCLSRALPASRNCLFGGHSALGPARGGIALCQLAHHALKLFFGEDDLIFKPIRLLFHADIGEYAYDKAPDDVDDHILHRIAQAVAVRDGMCRPLDSLPVHEDLRILDDAVLPALHIRAEQAVGSELDQLPDVLDGEREAEGEQHDKEGRKLDVPVARLVHQPDDGKGEQRKDDAARRMQYLIV